MTKLNLLPLEKYLGVNRADPIRFYYWPIIGSFYRKRVEMCLDECQGGERILEVGFGTGLSFLNLKEKYAEIYGVDLTADIPQVMSTFQGMNLPLHLENGNVMRLTFQDDFFDTVLLISILEHLNPTEQVNAFIEIKRVLKPGGLVVVGVPIERPFMVTMFRLMGVDIRKHHFSTDDEVIAGAEKVLKTVRLQSLQVPLIGGLYKVGSFQK